MAERGLTGAKAAEQAALRTRSGKHPYSREAIAEHWKAQAQEHGFDGDRVLAGALKAGDVTPTERFDDTRAILDASDRLSESEAAFLRGDLLRGQGRSSLALAHHWRHGILAALDSLQGAFFLFKGLRRGPCIARAQARFSQRTAGCVAAHGGRGIR